MGTIAARDALRILQLTEQVTAAHLIATFQGLRLREREDKLTHKSYSPEMCLFFKAIEKTIPFILEDQPLDAVLREVTSNIQSRTWSLYGEKE